jgi:creatinine amidohydrolase
MPVDGLPRDEGGVRSKSALDKGPISDPGELFAIIIAVARNGKVARFHIAMVNRSYRALANGKLGQLPRRTFLTQAFCLTYSSAGKQMKIADMNWMQVEEKLKRDARAVVPVGSTEQHGYLRLTVDAILAERVACEAAEPLGVPVFPVLSYGITPYFRAYPGTISLRLDTYQRIVADILDSLAATGFKRIMFVNGHGGNTPGSSLLQEWMNDHPGITVKWHNWWNAPRTAAAVAAIDAVASHASWMENFAWTRLADVKLPEAQKPLIDLARMRMMDAAAVRKYVGDGNYGGVYQKPDDQMMQMWRVGVEETSEALEGPWP